MIEYFKLHSKTGLVILMFLIFLASFGVHYFIFWSKGFVQTEYYNLLLARNWAQTGQIAYESKENVILSMQNIETQGMPANLGNKLTFFLYGGLFKIFGFYPDLPLYLTFILYSIGAVFIFLIGWWLFGWQIGVIAALLAVFAPFVLAPSNTIGYHEWAFLFLVLAAFFYFWPNQRKFVHLALVGIFLGLMVAAKNSFFVAVFPFLFLEFWQQKFTKVGFLNSGIIFIFFLALAAPFVFGGGNVHLAKNLSEAQYEPSAIFDDFFPDAYIFNYERNSFLDNLLANPEQYPGGEFNLWGKFGAGFSRYGHAVNFWRTQIIPRLFSTWIYFKGLFLSIVIFGGLFTWLLIFVGVSDLLKKKNYFFLTFATSFFIFWLFGLVALRTSNYSQFLILSLPAVFLIALGIKKIAEFVSQTAEIKRISRQFLAVIAAAVLLVFFAQISWWSLRELYANAGPEKMMFQFVHAPQNKNRFDEKGMTAVGWNKVGPLMLAYYLDHNFIYFAPETIQKLAAEEKLSQIFKNYNITGFIGYDYQLTDLINKNTGNKLKNYSADK